MEINRLWAIVKEDPKAGPEIGTLVLSSDCFDADDFVLIAGEPMLSLSERNVPRLKQLAKQATVDTGIRHYVKEFRALQ